MKESTPFGREENPLVVKVCSWLLKKIAPHLGAETAITCTCCGVRYRIAFDIHAMIEGRDFEDCVSLLPFPKRNSVAN